MSNNLQVFLEKAKPSITKVLPAHVSFDKFERCLSIAAMGNVDLSKASTKTLLASVIKSAQDGLMPDGKEAAIVTFNNRKTGAVDASYIPMTAGLLKLVRQSGEIQSITMNMIYEKDEFDYWVDEKGEKLKFKPNMFGDRGKAIGVFAQAVTKDGGCYIEIMTTEDIAKIKKASRGSKFGPWSGDFESEMWKKSALRRLTKRLPLSTDIESRIDFDETETTTEPAKAVVSEAAALAEPVKDEPSQLMAAIAQEKKEI